MTTITNRMIRQANRSIEPNFVKWRWIVAGLVWANGALYTYTTHPLLQDLTALRRAAMAAIGVIIYPLWPLFSGSWRQVSAGASRWGLDQFLLFYLGVSLCITLVPMLFYQYWLGVVASIKRQNVFRIEQHRLQQGRLSSKEAAAQLALADDGLPLAHMANGRKRGVLGISTESLEGHCLVIGPTRSGKGMHLTETLLTYRGAALVVDPKSEQYERTAGYREQFGPVYRLPEHTLDLSMYYDLGNRDDVAELHYHLLKPWSDKQPIFAEKSKSLFTAAFNYAVAHELNPIQVLLDSADDDPARVLSAFMTVDKNSVLAFTNGRQPNNMDRFSASAWGTFATRLYEYQQHWQTMVTFRPNTSIPHDWAAQNATIYITYRFDQLKGVGGMVSAMIAALLRHQVRNNLRDRAIIAVDELPVLGLRNVTDYLAHVGGYNLSLLLYAQTYSQLSELYGDRGAETMLSNCQHQVWYPPVDMVTAKRMEELYGTELHRFSSVSRSRQKDRLEIDRGSRGISVSEHLRKEAALDATKMMGLGQEQVILRAHRQYTTLACRLWPVERFAQLPKVSTLMRSMTRVRPKPHWSLSQSDSVTNVGAQGTDQRMRPKKPSFKA